MAHPSDPGDTRSTDSDTGFQDVDEILENDEIDIEETDVDGDGHEAVTALTEIDGDPGDESEMQPPEQEVIREITVERKGGFVPMVLGGAVAAALGFGGATVLSENGLPFGKASTQQINLQSALDQQAGRLDDLTQRVTSLPVVDDAVINANQAALGQLQGQVQGLSDQLDEFASKIARLEARPSNGAGVSGDVSAFEAELATLRAALDTQKGTVQKMLDEAQSKQASAADAARQTMTRAAITRILVALDSGSNFEDALHSIRENSDVDIPQALSETAATGVPTAAALQEQFAPAARAALAAARAEAPSGGFSSFLAKQLGARSVAPKDGDDADAVLSRAEAALKEGRISDALTQTQALSEAAQSALSAWSAQATLRVTALRDAEALASQLNSQ